MSTELEMTRKYTWGTGAYVYSRNEDDIYCHTTGKLIRGDGARQHIQHATTYTAFRYLDKPNVESITDDVRQPSHYQVFPDVESIEIIARSMTQAEFKGFCMGNVLKYRLRAGKKSELATMEKDLKKADFYKELFEQHKDKCYA